MKELIIKVEGSIVSSNLDDWKESAIGFLDTINTELVTDQDFCDAAKNIKACKEVEDRLDIVKAEIINQTVDIAKALEVIADVQSKYRDTRLELTRKEKTEKENRKREIVELGYQALSAIYSRSDVAFHLKTPDKSLVTEAIKGKKTLVSMDSAILDVIEAEKERIGAIETNFHTNILLIDEVEQGSIFPDKMPLAIGTEVEVRATIDARLAKLQLEQMQAKEREEAERLAAKQKAERLANEEATKTQTVEAVKQQDIQPLPPKTEIPPPPNFPEPPSFEKQSRDKYLVSFVVDSGEETAILLARGIRTQSGVTDVKITRCS